MKKAVAKKTAVKPSPKPTATSKPKKNAKILKKGGLAPGSKQVEIMQTQRKLKAAYDSPNVKDMFGKGPAGKAEKELNALRKSVGWKPSEKLSNRMYGANVTDKAAMKAKADARNKKKK